MTVLGPRLLNTVTLAAITALIAVPLAILLGILCASVPGRFIDRFLSTSTPGLDLGAGILRGLCGDDGAGGEGNGLRYGNPGSSKGFRRSSAYRMVPILTLELVILAHMVRNTRAAILSVMHSPMSR